jgi:hypothetical protein
MTGVMGNTYNIKAPSRDSSSNQDWALASAECTQSIFPLTLCTIRMDRGAWHIKLEEVIIDLVSRALRINKNDRTSGFVGVKEVNKSSALHGCLYVDNFLNDIDVGGASTADANPNMIMRKMLFSQVASSLRKGRREHHVSDVALLLIYLLLMRFQEAA